jgi:hypothetical protein
VYQVYPHVNGSPGTRILEIAYAKVLAQTLDNIDDESAEGLTPFTWAMYNKEAKLRTMTHLTGDAQPKHQYIRDFAISEDKLKETMHSLAADGNALMILGTHSTLGSDMHRLGRIIRPNHAFAVEKIDGKDESISFRDPHDSHVMLTLPWEELSVYFKDLYIFHPK